MKGPTSRDILATELQNRWDVMYRELRRRQKVLERAKAKAVAEFEAMHTEYFKMGERVSMLPHIPQATQEYLDQWAAGTEVLRGIVLEIGQALERVKTQLRQHEQALPGLRDTDPRALLEPTPYERHRIAANARQQRYLAKRKANDQTLAAS